MTGATRRTDRVPGSGRALMLDLFVRLRGLSSPPLVVFAHGGAVRKGDRTMVSRPLLDLSNQGRRRRGEC
jgi:hypothetical protein